MTDVESTNPAHDPRLSEPAEPVKLPGGNGPSGALQYGGGAGRFDGMEARIAHIEAHVDHMRDDIGDMRLDLRETTKTVISVASDMRELDSRVASLPGKGWTFFAMLLFTAIICAVILYLEQIRQYLSILPPSLSP